MRGEGASYVVESHQGSAAAATGTAPLQGAKPDGRPAPGPVGQRASGHERRKSASGSEQKRRTLRRVLAVSVRRLNSRSFYSGELRGVPAEVGNTKTQASCREEASSHLKIGGKFTE